MKLKKLAAFLLSAVMAVGLSTAAFAATPPTTGSITVQAQSAGRDLAAYRLFDATTDGTSYGYTLNDTYKDQLCEALNVDKSTPGAQISDKLLQALSALSSDATKAKAFAIAMQGKLSTLPGDVTLAEGATTGGKTTYSVTGIPLGYYIVVDQGAGSEEYAPTFAMLNSTKTDVSVEAKDSTVTSDKKLSTDGSKYQQTGSVNIGDTVTYKITGDIPAYVSSSNDQYKVNLTDTLPANGQLQYIGISSVVLSGNGITNPFKATDVTFKDKNNDATTDMTKAVSFVFDKLVLDKANGVDYLNDKPAAVTITYTAKVVNAEKIVDANTNTFTYTYGKPGSTFTQDPKKAIVYTYGFKVFKYAAGADKAKTPLAGAEFNLLKNGTALKFNEQKDGSGSVTGYVYDPAGPAGAVTTLVSGTDGYVNVYGLDAGTYTLKETKAPNGYNLLADTIDVTIAAKADSQGVANGDCTVSYKATHAAGDAAAVSDYTIDVLNTTGTQLPGTGGMGTTLFTVGGLLILCAAGAFLFFNRKHVFGK